MALRELNRSDIRSGCGGGDADNIDHPRREPRVDDIEDLNLNRPMPHGRVEPRVIPQGQSVLAHHFRQGDSDDMALSIERSDRSIRARFRGFRGSVEENHSAANTQATATATATVSRSDRVVISVPCVIPTPRRSQRRVCEMRPNGIEAEYRQQVEEEPEVTAPAPIIRFILRIGYNALLYPYEFAKVLIQLGHEPLAPRPFRWPFLDQRPHFFLPGVHRYVQHIQQVDGYLGLYRGLPARLISSSVEYLMGDVFLNLIGLTPYQNNNTNSSSIRTRPGWTEFFYNLLRNSLRLCTAVALSHPFHVVMVRQIAQFIGREAVYDGVLSGLRFLITQEGWIGMYAGVVPRLVGEMTVLFVTSCLSHMCRRLIPMSRMQQQYNAVIIQMVASLLVYPLEVTSSCMACSGAPLTACEPPKMPVYINWADCLTDLYTRGGHNRGALLFWRTVPRIQLQWYLLEPPPGPTRLA